MRAIGMRIAMQDGVSGACCLDHGRPLIRP
jgi:hypothetical protein